MKDAQLTKDKKEVIFSWWIDVVERYWWTFLVIK